MAGAVACSFPAELWTLARVGALLEVEFGSVCSTTQMWRLLRGLGFSNQQPTGRAIRRDEPANSVADLEALASASALDF